MMIYRNRKRQEAAKAKAEAVYQEETPPPADDVPPQNDESIPSDEVPPQVEVEPTDVASLAPEVPEVVLDDTLPEPLEADVPSSEGAEPIQKHKKHKK